MSRPPFDHFRFFAPIYDFIFNAESGHDGLGEMLDLPIDGWLLDAGGGTGRISHGFSAQAGGVVVVDASFGMLQQARRKDDLRAAFSHVEQLPFPDGQFERILIVDAFHHFHHYEEAARELWRVLSPGGRLVIHEPNIARWQVKFIALGEKLTLMRSHFFNADEMRIMFAAQTDAQVTVDVESDPFYIQLVAEKMG